ncbi:SAE2-domain-containing protein [Amniculicola lignicola CBS 123094]|uniref:SAE2-domain-containing protein n=1 Tax=Amniculicola lignicola CBS 123094 TaxID=1392246 RepID=A0A6A5WNN8_9PLEO|nr:SAE2-domain-containing protein [Amniculicola lignicola CBS 123094]
MSDNAAWLDKHRTLLTCGLRSVSDEVIDNLQMEIKRRDDAHEKELKIRDDEQQELFLRFNQEVSKNIHLVDENSEFKHELKGLQQKFAKSGIDATGQGTRPNVLPNEINMDVTVPREEFRHLSEKYNELSEMYQDTARKARYLEKKVISVMQKNKDMKENVRLWQEYSAREIAKKEGTPKTLPKSDMLLLSAVNEPLAAKQRSPVNAFLQTPQPLGRLDRSSPLLMPPFDFEILLPPQESTTVPSTESGQVHTVDNTAATSAPNHEPPVPDLRYTRSYDCGNDARTTTELVHPATGFDRPEDCETIMTASSQTTQDEPMPHLSDQTDHRSRNLDEDDVPEIVSERCLKRKRAPPSNFEVYTDCVRLNGTPDNPYRIKEEFFSSPPRPILGHPLVRKETLDLDELGPNEITTTQRRRQLRRAPSNLMNILRHQRSTSEPLIKDEPRENYPPITNDNEQVLIDASVHDLRALSEPTEPALNAHHALQPVDGNVRANESPNEDSPRKRLEFHQIRQLWKYQTVTESGENRPPTKEHTVRLTPNAARAHINKRIHATKKARTHQEDKQQTPARGTKTNPLALPERGEQNDTPSSRPGSRKGPMAPRRPGPRAGKISKVRLAPEKYTSTAPWPGPQKNAATSAGPNPSSTVVSQTPIRFRPLAELKISDFKPNPAYTDGYSFAFTETVRKRADRACLAGCSREDCCGSHFRVLATVAHPLTPFEEESLLKEHLGDAYDSMCLTQMSTDERKELVLQARTRQMAQKHGKHRQAFERHTTPPGFWRVDFPSTQEEQDDRVKAAQMEKKMVEERRMEAMRKGGRWLFRDE